MSKKKYKVLFPHGMLAGEWTVEEIERLKANCEKALAQAESEQAKVQPLTKMQQLDQTMRAAFEAIQEPAPETPSNSEQTKCEYCGTWADNGDLTIVSDHCLCPACNLDGDALYSLSRAIEEEQSALIAALKASDELIYRAQHYRAPLRHEPAKEKGAA